MIKPIVQARITAPLSTVFIFGDPEFKVSGPVYIWLIAEERTLVDTGVSEKAIYPVEGGGERSLIKALERENLRAEDIGRVIITHLHFDHSANVHLFHNAKIYVQKKEWKFAWNPLPIFRDLYVEEHLLNLESMDICLVDGDFEVSKNIKLVHLPGHTPGLQGVLVKNKYLLASDHFYTYLNIYPPKNNIEIERERKKAIIPAQKSPFLPIGLNTSLIDWFDSSYKAVRFVRKSSIIPGHEPDVEGKIFE